MSKNIKHKLPVILLLAVPTTLNVVDAPAQTPNTRNISNYDFWSAGDPANEKAHHTEVGGKTALKSITSSIGLIDKKYETYHFRAKGDSISMVMDIQGMAPKSSDTPVMLEIREIHEGSPCAFGYTVLVENHPVYFRTYEELVQAPLNYFIAVDRTLIRNPAEVHIAIRSASNSPFNISNIWAYGDFYALASNQGLFFPMKIYNYVDKEEKMGEITSRYKTCEDFCFGVMFGMPYLQLKKQELITKISSLLSTAKAFNLPFAIMKSRWWGHTAYSPDGLGGYFGDLKYNQILFSSEKGHYYVTTPNMWSSTPWPSMNNEYANEIAKQKLTVSSRFLGDQYALMQISPGGMPKGSLVMEEGSGFWTEGDFSYDVISAAKADGIDLNPEDGLDKKEKTWMQKDIAAYNDLLAKGYLEGLGTNAVLVDQGKIVYPKFQFFDNIYTHCLQATLYPSYDDRIPGWMGGVSQNMWPSSEMYAFTDQRHNEYSMNFGKLACVNMWVPMMKSDEFSNHLRNSYKNGMDFLVMFGPEQANWDVAEQIKKADHLMNVMVEPSPEYMPHVLDIDYLRDYHKDMIAKPMPGIQYKGIKAEDNSGIGKGFICQENPLVPGEVIYRFEDKDQFQNGLIFYVEGKTTNGGIDIFAGDNQANMINAGKFAMGQQKDWFNPHSPNLIDLGNIAHGKKQVFVKLILQGIDGQTSIRTVKAFLPWNQKTGPIGFRNDTYKERRIQNTWIQYRVVADRMLTKYVQKKGSPDEISQQAEDLFRRGCLMDGIRLLEKEISEVIPARYAIRGYGQLGKYPLMIRLPNPSDCAVVKLLSYNPRKSEIGFYVDKPMEIQIKRIDAENDLYQIKKTGEMVYVIEKLEGAQAGSNPQEIGVMRISVNPKNENPLLDIHSIEGKVLQVNDQTLTIECQDPKIGEFSSSGVQLQIRTDCLFERKPYGSNKFTTGEHPKVNDKVAVKLDGNGKVIKVAAEYGLIQSIIKTFDPPELQSKNPHNGIVELENGMKFELSFNRDHSILNIPPLNGLAIKYDVNEIIKAIQPGLKVEIVYCPYTYNGSNIRVISMNALH